MEALGGAAGVIGVVSLSIQVCDELKKVQSFWQSVKEAPDDIAQFCTEIDIFMTWLTIIANKYQRHGFRHGSPDEVAATDALKLCLATVHDMNDRVKDLESGLTRGLSSKRWASLKFVFRKDKMEKLMKQIERMKSLLVIVQTCYIGEVQEAGFKYLSLGLGPQNPPLSAKINRQSLDTSTVTSTNESLVPETRLLQPIPKSPAEVMSFSPTVSPQAPCRPKHRTTQQERAYNFGLAMLRLVTTEQESFLTDESGNERRTASRRNRYDLRIAQWLLSRGFTWQSFGMYGSWQYSFRTFRYISNDALIVDYCIDGDLKNVQKLFDKGLASPFDRVMIEDELEYQISDGSIRVEYECEDWSLLHFSIAGGHATLCKFLIECGLGQGSASGMSREPILSLAGSYRQDWTASDPAAHLDTLRIMINDGQYDPMEKAKYTSVMHSFEGSSTVYRWLLEQEEFVIDFEQTIHNYKTVATALIGSLQLNASECLEELIAHGAAWSLSDVADNPDLPRRIKVLWDAGADFHTPHAHDIFGTLNLVFTMVILGNYQGRRTKYNKYGVERESIPNPSLISTKDVIEYDQLEDPSDIKCRSRVSKSLWHTWFPGDELPILEVAQRWLDAWLEILLEAGLDIAEYGRREDQLHPEGLLHSPVGELRIIFEYGDHVGGCRIHATEIWMVDPEIWMVDPDYKVHDFDVEEESTAAEHSSMPGRWDFDDE